MTVNPMNFISSLSYMAVGMVTIFMVIGLIVALTMFLNMATDLKGVAQAEYEKERNKSLKK